MSSDPECILYSVEKAFGVTIPIKDAVEMRTVGDLLRFLRDKVTPRVDACCLTMQTFFRFRAEIMQTLGLARSLVRPQSKIEDIIPPKDRRKFWKQLRKAGFEPPRLSPLIPVGFVGLGAVVGLLLCLGLMLRFPSAILLLVMVLLGTTFYVTRWPLAIHLFPGCTVGDLVLHMTPVRNGSGTSGMTDNEINEKARVLIADAFFLPLKDVTDNVQFKDLDPGDLG